MKIPPQQFLSAIGAALVFLTGMAAILMFFRLAHTTSWVSHTLQLRAAAKTLLIDLQDAEVGARGYLLAHADAFLQPYENGTARAQTDFAKLKTLTHDNPEQQQLLQKLHPLISSKLQFLQEAVAMAKSGQADRVVATIKEGQNNARMEDIRDLLEEFDQTEQTLLAGRQEDDRVARDLLLALMLGGLAAASLAAVAAVRAQSRLVKSLKEEARRRELAEASLRQAQKMEAVGQLTGGVAHDFNNLLTVILGNLDTVRRRLAGADPALAARLLTPVDAASEGGKRAARLTQRLLAFSRQQALEPAPLDLNKLLAGISELLERTVGSPVALETVLSGGLWLTFADANQVENALLNLVINARDAMPGGGKITIETANAYLDEDYAAGFCDVKAGQYAVLSVTDTGCGIPASDLSRVFEPFFTTKQPGEGTGLGLSMVHGFVKQSGGHIRIYSEEGEGTTVKIYLPRLTQAAAEATPAVADLRPRPAVRADTSETILVVEDSDGVLAFAVSALAELGYRVLSAKDGREALRILEADRAVDLLFTDVVLPEGMSGRQLAEAASHLRPGLPVLFTTGYSRNAIVHQGRLDANVHLLTKPYTQIELAHRIRTVLDKKEKAGSGA